VEKINVLGQVHQIVELQCVALCCSVLQCVAVCCSALQCVYLRASSQRDQCFGPSAPDY